MLLWGWVRGIWCLHLEMDTNSTPKQQSAKISLLFTLVERNVKPNERSERNERKQENTKEEKKEKRVEDNFISIVKYNIYRIII